MNVFIVDDDWFLSHAHLAFAHHNSCLKEKEAISRDAGGVASYKGLLKCY